MRNMIALIVSLLISGLALALSSPTYTVSYQIFEGDELLVSPQITLLKGEVNFITNLENKVVEVETKLSEIKGDNKDYYLSSTLMINGIKVASVEKNIAVGSTFTFVGSKYKIVTEFEEAI